MSAATESPSGKYTVAEQHGPHVRELAGAYALGALEPDERLRADEHLDGCSACLTAIAGARRVAALLPYAAEPREPPTYLEAQLMARLARAPQDDQPPQGLARPRVPRLSVHRSAARARRVFALAAAMSVVLGLGIWNLRLQAERAQQPSAAALVAHGVPRDLVAGPAGGAGQGRAYLDLGSDHVLLVVSRLPELSGEREYQLWFVRPDGGRDTGGTFRVDGNGNGVVLARAPAGLGAYTAVGVTAEPTGGSPAPTTPNVVGGPL